jgi:pimeloyl-ACP methyl ester carboxylesterase
MSRAILKTAFVFVFAAIIIPTLLIGQEQADSKTKNYYGILDAKLRVFRFVVSVAEDNSSATLKSLDEGQQVFKLEDFSIGDKMSFKLKRTVAEYSGSFNKDKNQFVGKWKQGGNELDLNFLLVEKTPDENTTEIWEGEINTGVQKLKLRFKLFDEKSKYPVVMDSVTQRVGGFTGTTQNAEGKMFFSIPALRGKLTAILSEDKKTLKGTWNQGIDFPIELKKVSAAEAQKKLEPPKRPQTPKAPFPYESEEVEIENKSAKLTLAATLTMPITDEKSPCVVLISGSGAQDRDETLLDHKPFLVIADFLTRRGIAVLRFDDRGTAKSTGDHSTATSADFATDVSAIVDFLKTHKKIASDQIGLCGHSEGGLIAPMVAASRNDIAFLIMLAGPGVNGEKILQNQIGLILAASGEKPEAIAEAKFVQRKMIELVKKAKDDAEITQERIEMVVDEFLKKYPDNKNERDALITNVGAGIARLKSPWMKYFFSYEPSTSLMKTECPVLVLNGAKDTQVDPKLNIPAIKSVFESAKKTNFEVVEYPNLNHLFQVCKTGAPAEYNLIEETFSEEVLKKMAQWIDANAR